MEGGRGAGCCVEERTHCVRSHSAIFNSMQVVVVLIFTVTCRRSCRSSVDVRVNLTCRPSPLRHTDSKWKDKKEEEEESLFCTRIRLLSLSQHYRRTVRTASLLLLLLPSSWRFARSCRLSTCACPPVQTIRIGTVLFLFCQTLPRL